MELLKKCNDAHGMVGEVNLDLGFWLISALVLCGEEYTYNPLRGVSSEVNGLEIQFWFTHMHI